MTAYFNTEIIDAYCRMLILAKQLGPINYLGEKDVQDLMEFKRRLKIDDPRLHMENCDLCGNSLFREGYDSFVPHHQAFPVGDGSRACKGRVAPPAEAPKNVAAPAPAAEPAKPASNAAATSLSPYDLEGLVQTITEQVMAQLGGKA